MNIFYLLSVIGTRFLNLLSVILLSYLLSPSDFGRYSLVITNGLFLHVIFSSWITNCLWRDASKASQEALSSVVGYALNLAAWISLSLAVIGLLYLAIVHSESQVYGFVPILAAANLLSELVSVVLNARHADRAYSLVSVLRGLVSLVLSVCTIALGFGVEGVLVAQLVGVLSALLLVASSRNVLTCCRDKSAIPQPLIQMMAFGLNSAIALNLYLIINALCRNVIAYRLGEENAGYFSLASDLFYAPIALVATSLSLSNIPLLYRSSSGKTDEEAVDLIDVISLRFILTTLAVALPYALGGWFVAPELIELVLSSQAAAQLSNIAFLGAIQGSCFAIISTKTTIALTRGETRSSIMFSSMAVLLTSAFLLLANSTLSSMSLLATLGLAITSAVCVCSVCMRPRTRTPILGILKIALATVAMLPGLFLTRELLNGWMMISVAILASVPSYLLVGSLLNCDAIRSLYRFERAKSRVAI